MWKYFFDCLVKMRERGVARWAIKFLKIDEAPAFIRYGVAVLLILLFNPLTLLLVVMLGPGGRL